MAQQIPDPRSTRPRCCRYRCEAICCSTCCHSGAPGSSAMTCTAQHGRMQHSTAQRGTRVLAMSHTSCFGAGLVYCTYLRKTNQQSSSSSHGASRPSKQHVTAAQHSRPQRIAAPTPPAAASARRGRSPPSAGAQRPWRGTARPTCAAPTRRRPALRLGQPHGRPGGRGRPRPATTPGGAAPGTSLGVVRVLAWGRGIVNEPCNQYWLTDELGDRLTNKQRGPHI